MSGDIENIQKILKDEEIGPESDYRQCFKEALKCKRLDIAQLLFDHTLDILMMIFNTEMGVIEQFIEMGGNLNNAEIKEILSTFLSKAIFEYKIPVIKFLCRHGADVNAINSANMRLLSYAIFLEHYEAAKELLEWKANVLFLTKKDMVRLQQDKSYEAQELYQQLMKQYTESFKNKLLANQLTLKDIINIPKTLILDEKEQALLCLQLKVLIEKSGLGVAIIEKLINPLSIKYVLKLKNLCLLNIITEMAETILHPEMIDQGMATLCGPASFLSLLAHEKPELYIDMGLSLVSLGKTKKPFPLTVSKYSREEAASLNEVLMVEIRRYDNWTGYSPKSRRAGFQGLTAPRSLAQWLEASGISSVEDHTSVPLRIGGRPLSRPIRLLLNIAFGGFHKKGHQELSKKEKLQYLIQTLASGKRAILLISGRFSKKICHLMIAPSQINFCCGVSIDHYVYVKQMECRNNNIHYEFMTYGRIFQGFVNLDYFLKHFRGAIITDGSNLKTKRLFSDELRSLEPKTDSKLKRESDVLVRATAVEGCSSSNSSSGSSFQVEAPALTFLLERLRMIPAFEEFPPRVNTLIAAYVGNRAKP